MYDFKRQESEWLRSKKRDLGDGVPRLSAFAAVTVVHGTESVSKMLQTTVASFATLVSCLSSHSSRHERLGGDRCSLRCVSKQL